MECGSDPHLTMCKIIFFSKNKKNYVKFDGLIGSNHPHPKIQGEFIPGEHERLCRCRIIPSFVHWRGNENLSNERFNMIIY